MLSSSGNIRTAAGAAQAQGFGLFQHKLLVVVPKVWNRLAASSTICTQLTDNCAGGEDFVVSWGGCVDRAEIGRDESWTCDSFAPMEAKFAGAETLFLGEPLPVVAADERPEPI
jgi:hypothetical protein